MFYWTVVNDLSGKHDKLRKEFDDIVESVKPAKAPNKRGSIFGAFSS